MNPILYDYSEQNFTTNGLGRLTGCVRCTVHEVLNGVYELEMVYPVDGEKFAELKEGRIIYAIHDDTKTPQPFEIYRISRPLNGKVTVNAWHISYKLRKIVCKPFTAEGVQTALNKLMTEAITTNPFIFFSDKDTTATMTAKIPTAVRSLMGGVQGSVIDTYGGEWEFDKWQCVLRNRRGQDTDVSIRYGKNLSQLNRTSDMTNLWSGVVPYWNGQAEGGGEDSTYYNGVVWAESRDTFYEDMVVSADCSSFFDSKPTQAQMKTWAESYIRANARAAIPVSTKISFVQLWQTEEYKDVAPLQRLFIGDRVNVKYEKLGVDDTARIVEYMYNVLEERYDSMVLGEVRASIAQKVQEEIDKMTKDLPTKSFFERAIDKATELITGGLGGYVVINRNADGEPEEILVMNTPDKTTATKVMRINQNGIGFGNGYNGPFNSAWTIDGTFDAKQINVINLNAASIVTGILKDAGNNTSFNLETGEFTMNKGSINIGNGTFKVDQNGHLTAVGVSLTGDIRSVDSDGREIWVETARISGSYRQGSSVEFSGSLSFHDYQDGVGHVKLSAEKELHLISKGNISFEAGNKGYAVGYVDSKGVHCGGKSMSAFWLPYEWDGTTPTRFTAVKFVDGVLRDGSEP